MGKFIDLTGKVFNRLTVLSRAENNKSGSCQWNCICQCGKNTRVLSSNLTTGNIKSCGCLKLDDLTGQTFSRLTVISRAEKDKRNKSQWNCLCSCGKNIRVVARSLKSGGTKSCGCLNTEKRKTNNLIHGMSYSPEYTTWKSIKARCYGKNSLTQLYRDKGIKVCDRWLESFENFYEDMGDRPSSKHSIDRIDNDGDYCPENCRWATAKEQSNNRSKNVKMTLDGETKTIAEWAKVLGIRSGVIGWRKRSGWSDEKALTTPCLTKSVNGSISL
jgi:hypothetical protein